MTTLISFTLDDSLAEQARVLGVNISAAARAGVEVAVRAAQLQADRLAYQKAPEKVDGFWSASRRRGILACIARGRTQAARGA